MLTTPASSARVDKYGRPLADDHEQDNLRRFYRLEDEDEAQLEVTAGPDYARGGVLLESSDEEDDRPGAPESDDESEAGGIVTLGRDVTQPIPVLDDTAEVDLDEDNFADLEAQAAEYAKVHPEDDQEDSQASRTRRLAVVNLDWDHVRAIHLYKIFSSLVSPTGAAVASGSKGKRDTSSSSSAVRGKVLSVRVYPSQFGKERMAREETEGPPPEVFKRRELEPEEINERTIYETGDGEDYDEEALRNYQLERLRYVTPRLYRNAAAELSVDTTTPSQNVTQLKRLRTSITSWREPSLNAPQTCSTSASYRTA